MQSIVLKINVQKKIRATEKKIDFFSYINLLESNLKSKKKVSFFQNLMFLKENWTHKRYCVSKTW